MEESSIHEFDFRSGLFDRARKLIITPDFIEFDNTNLQSDRPIRIEKLQFKDVRYSSEAIIWYKFHLGYSYRIQIRYDDGKVLVISFSSYTWNRKKHAHLYPDISRYLGNYFLIDRINAVLDLFSEEGLLEMPGLIIRKENVSFQNPDHSMEWTNVGLKEYYSYYAIFDKTNADIHKRVTFDEWNAEILFYVLKRLIEDKQSQ